MYVTNANIDVMSAVFVCFVFFCSAQRVYNWTQMNHDSDASVPEPLVVNATDPADWQNTTMSSGSQTGTLRVLVVSANNAGLDDSSNSWFIHEFDNVTVIDNAPYVGLRKAVDSLTQYLLVGCNLDLRSRIVTVAAWCMPRFLSFGLRSLSLPILITCRLQYIATYCDTNLFCFLSILFSSTKCTYL